jgi:uncharacterized membrane protein YcjF (UPF0283 family)
MSIVDEVPVEPQPPAPQPAAEAVEGQAKGRGKRRAFSSARRELNEKELSSTAVIKLLMDDIDRLEDEKSELASFRGKYHDADKKNSVLEQKSKINITEEIVSITCLAVGAAAIGYAPNAWNAQPTGYFLLTFGALLIIGGVVAKVAKT